MVPDTSVIVAAFFDEPETRSAQRLVDAIETDRVKAFAPHALIVEFLKTANEKRSRRLGAARLDPELVERQIERFFEMRITYVRETDLQAEAWRLMQARGVPPPDSWMLACAMRFPGSELWVSHDHADGFVEAARLRHPNVFTLASHPSRLP